MSDLNEIRRKFAIPDALQIDAGQGGLPRVVITTAQVEAHVYLHGAHVTHFRPAGQEPVLFLSAQSLFQPAKPIRGGVPMIFPWFGPRAGDPASPMHGFARTSEWELIDVRRKDQRIAIVLEMKSSPATLATWPHAFALRYTVDVGATLDLSLEVTNTSNSAFTFEEALHTYLSVGDVRQVKIDGLSGRQFLDKTDSMRRKTQPADSITIGAETDRLYLSTRDRVIVTDPSLKRQLVVDKSGSDSTVVWNPWIAKSKAMADFGDDEWPRMLCIETANAADNAVNLPAGQIHRMTATIATQPLLANSARSSVRQWEMSGSPTQHI